jgi:hypothetical protein
MRAVRTTYDVVLSGVLDQSMLALIAEYDLGDVPVQVVLRGLVVDQATFDSLLDRAHVLGVVITRARRVDGGADEPGGGHETGAGA